MNPRVFTIPASAPFLPTLIEALLGGGLGLPALRDPLALASATLYLPTRRACRLARDTFLDVLKDDAAILPRIVAIGDIDEDEIAFAEAATGEHAAEALALPEALDGLERRLLLTQLIVKWANSPDLHGQSGTPLVAQTPAAACVLADDLARLIDDMTTRGVPWKRLDELVPDNFDRYWQQTLKFLEIAREAWPAILRERHCIEAAERRDKLIKAEATRLTRKTDGLVIAAGSTGSIPATAELIATIAGLPHGAVVLPGLDTDLDEESWRLIAGDPKKKLAAAPGHPQFAMQALLTRIGIARSAVNSLAKANGREALLSEAMRPAMQTDVWQQHASDLLFATRADAAVSTMTVIEAANAEEEALAVAIALREAVQDGKTAALVTPDRVLGRRVAAALMRWDIAVEDTGGDPLAETPAGNFARLAAQAATAGLEPVTLLALLKHPLLRLGASDQRYATDILERAVLRGPRPSRGTAGLARALKTLRAVRETLHPSDPRKDLSEGQIGEAENLVAKLTEALRPLEKSGNDAQPLNDLAARHREVLA
ncbi:MAG: double-strand break repair protein AddB, partial [Xanthobacteraceae bacterium]